VVAIESGPPTAVTETCAVAVVEPDALVAVRVYVVVAVGFTGSEPLAEVDVKLPGLMAMLVAPVTAQTRLLLDPAVMPVGLAVNDVMTGVADELTVTVVLFVTDPAEFVAVRT
jgi:hypothetical protein